MPCEVRIFYSCLGEMVLRMWTLLGFQPGSAGPRARASAPISWPAEMLYEGPVGLAEEWEGTARGWRACREGAALSCAQGSQRVLPQSFSCHSPMKGTESVICLSHLAALHAVLMTCKRGPLLHMRTELQLREGKGITKVAKPGVGES